MTSRPQPRRSAESSRVVAELNVEVVAVEERLWSGRAKLVIAQTTEGEIGVMAGHEPLLGQLVEGGIIAITTVDDERMVAAVHGGFLSVTAETVTVLAESADWSTDIDIEEAREALHHWSAEATADEKAALRARGRIRAVERS
jgi:F-type H+-transporting ATPase subunit epsilon